MKRNAIYLIALAALTSAASLAAAADDPESKAAAAAVDGKTIVIQSGGGGGGFGTFQPARSLRLNLQPATRKLEKGSFLGIMVTTVTPELRSQLKLQPGVGLVVQSVTADSPAAAAGVEKYDILQQFNDQLLIDGHQFGVLTRLTKPGKEVALKLVRKGEPLTLKVKPVERDLPPLDDAGLPREARPFFEGDQLTLEKSEEPMNRALEILRRNRDASGQFSYADKGMTLQITQKDGDRQLVAKDAGGKVLYNGPINTDIEKNLLPGEVAKRLKEMEGGGEGKK